MYHQKFNLKDSNRLLIVIINKSIIKVKIIHKHQAPHNQNKKKVIFSMGELHRLDTHLRGAMECQNLTNHPLPSH